MRSVLTSMMTPICRRVICSNNTSLKKYKRSYQVKNLIIRLGSIPRGKCLDLTLVYDYVYLVISFPKTIDKKGWFVKQKCSIISK